MEWTNNQYFEVFQRCLFSFIWILTAALQSWYWLDYSIVWREIWMSAKTSLLCHPDRLKVIYCHYHPNESTRIQCELNSNNKRCHFLNEHLIAVASFWLSMSKFHCVVSFGFLFLSFYVCLFGGTQPNSLAFEEPCNGLCLALCVPDQ